MHIARIVFVGLVSLAIAMGIGRFAITPLLPMMEAEGLVSIAGGGALAAVHFVGYLIGAVAATRLPVSPKTALRGSVIAIGICTLGMGATESFPLWLVFRWLAGTSSAVILVLVSNFYLRHLARIGRPEKQGWVFGGVGAGIAVAGLGAVGFMVWQVSSPTGWQVFGTVTLVSAVAVCMLVDSEIPGVRPGRRNHEVRRSPLNWGLMIAYAAAGMGYIIPATYLPIMAREIVTDPLVFGWAWPVFGAAAFLSTLLAARLQPRFSNRQVWLVSQAIMAIGLILPVVYPSIVTIQVAGFCVGGTFMIITMVGLKEAHRIAPVDDVMRHIGSMTVAFAIGQMTGPVLASALHDLTGGFALSLTVPSVALILTMIPLMSGFLKQEAASS